MTEWKSKYPPIYVWEEDTWYNETNKLIYKPSIIDRYWYAEESDPIPFPEKTVIMVPK